MKKYRLFIIFIIFAVLIGLNACSEDAFKEAFTPAAYKIQKTPSHVRNQKMIERIEANIVKYRKQMARGKDKSFQLSKAYISLGEKYIDVGDFPSAIKNLELAEEFGYQAPHLYYLLGATNANLARIKESSGNSNDIQNAKVHYQKAEYFYRKTVELKSNYYDAWYGLAVLLFYATNTDLSRAEAIIILQKLAQQNPRYYRGRFALAMFYYQTENSAASLAEYEKLLKDLSELKSNPMIAEYKERCRENIAVLLTEISRK